MAGEPFTAMALIKPTIRAAVGSIQTGVYPGYPTPVYATTGPIPTQTGTVGVQDPAMPNQFTGTGAGSEGYPTGNPFPAGTTQAIEFTACLLAGHAFSTCLNRVLGLNGGNGNGGESTGLSGTGGCPTGYEWDGTQCRVAGVPGTVQRTVPGGATGYMEVGQVAQGRYGAAELPAQVGTVTNSRGETGPLLRCRKGLVLGDDDLCYRKGDLRRDERKWPPGTKPLLTGGEVRMLRKIDSLQNKVQKAWARAGKPGQRKAPPRPRKRHR
jgi:hypothetical protein